MERTDAPSDVVREDVPARSIASAFSPPKRLLLLAINYWPLLHVAGTVLLAALPWATWPWRLGTALAALYLLPPITARLLLWVLPIREGRIPLGGRDYFTWWALACLQTAFCRLPMLEECLRLVPGIYSMWLRMWGARVGRLTYWAAGLRILDRSFLNIGDDVVFGAAVRVNPHVIARNERGEMELILATVVIGDRAVIGGYALLTSGTVIEADECTKAFLLSPPFGHWKNGVRISKSDGPP